ncbi:MAG: ribonuclease Z [Niabella sp.]
MLGVTILGNNSAVAAYGRHPSSQIVSSREQLFLIDCGEGTQFQMNDYKIKRNKISHIFISHLHGDHYFGLIGLLTSYALLGRTQDLHIYAPAPLQEIIHIQVNCAGTRFPYDLIFHPITGASTLVSFDGITVKSFPTNHRIECYGFVFEEKRKPRKIIHEKIEEYHVPYNQIEALKSGADFEKEDGSIIPNAMLTEAAPPGKKYAYCADTRYDESIVPHIQNADMIYHETTYLRDFKDNAVLRFHSTTHEAATIAQKANVKKLLIGHFSSKYESLDAFLTEATEVFPQTELAEEGVSFRI